MIENQDWKAVSRDHPCPICHKPDWCMWKTNGEVCVCRRMPSDHPSASGGWVHFLAPSAPRPRVPSAPIRRAPPPPVRDFSYHAKAAVAALTAERLFALEQSLGLDALSILPLDPGWDSHENAYTFPMRDADGTITGIRLRNALGEKWAVRGSRQGLFYNPLPGRVKEIVVCEGPTDCAALIDLCLFGVGRPSCQGCEEEIVRLARRLKADGVTVIADEDALSRRSARHDGTTAAAPGLGGAARLQAVLRAKGIPSRVVMPPLGHKDIRAWVNAGAKRLNWSAVTSRVAFR